MIATATEEPFFGKIASGNLVNARSMRACFKAAFSVNEREVEGSPYPSILSCVLS